MDLCYCHALKTMCNYYVTKGKICEVTQGNVRFRMDGLPQEVCQHWILACRGGEQAGTKAEEDVRAVSKGMSIYMAQYNVLIVINHVLNTIKGNLPTR